MLLTSSQVSVAVSSGVVFFFTAALFLSGFAIQQRTLNDLRAAIRPAQEQWQSQAQAQAASPDAYFPAAPDRFLEDTTELPDGTVVALRPASRLGLDDGADGDDGGGDFVRDDGNYQEQQQQQKGFEVRVKTPAVVDDQEEEEEEYSDLELDLDLDLNSDSEPPDEDDRGTQYIVKEGKEEQKPVSPAERRRLIREEIKRLAQLPRKREVYKPRRLW